MMATSTTFTWLRVELAPADAAMLEDDGIGVALTGLGYREIERTRLERGDRKIVLYGLDDRANLPFAIERRRGSPRDRIGLLIPQLRL